MFNVYDLMKSGMSAEEIAAEFTQNLNDAETRIEAERIEEARRREEAKRADAEKAAARNAKREDFAALASLFFHTIGKHYPNIAGEATELTEEECLALADLIILAIDLEAMRMSMVSEPTDEVKPVKESKVDPFAAFFKQFGL